MAAARSIRLILPWLGLAAFFTYFAVLIYSERYQPGDTGLRCDFSERTMRVAAVSRDSPSGRAGILPGDVVLAVDGRMLSTWEDWRYFRATRELGRTYLFRICSPDGLVDIPLIMERHPSDPSFPLERKRYVQGSLLSLAFAMIFFGTKTPVKMIAAWLLASIGTAPLFPDAEMTAVWRGLPTLLASLLWIPQLSHLMLLPLCFTFFALLPRPLFNGKWPWAIVWLPALMIAAWATPRLYAQIYNPPVVQELPAWVRLVLGLGVVLYCAGGLTAFCINYRRSAVQDRVRFRVLILGAFVGLAPVIPFLAAIFLGTLTQSAFVWFFVSDAYRHNLVMLFIAFPICLVYAIVRHHVLRVTEPCEVKLGSVT